MGVAGTHGSTKTLFPSGLQGEAYQIALSFASGTVAFTGRIVVALQKTRNCKWFLFIHQISTRKLKAKPWASVMVLFFHSSHGFLRCVRVLYGGRDHKTVSGSESESALPLVFLIKVPYVLDRTFQDGADDYSSGIAPQMRIILILKTNVGHVC